MKKLINETFRQEYVEEVLDCGLKVVVFYKPGFISSVAAIGTPYGALKIHEMKDGKEYHFHPGIAHFLEHKLFETDDRDIMNDFAGIGANVNALTSYQETVYYFSSNGDIEQPLNMLLDFVFEFSISEQSVEKEKGIIVEELNMYLSNPITRLLNEAYKAMYHHFPLKYDIGGDEESVKAITKQELEECYRLNYHPSNMVLCISSGQDPEKIIEIVKRNMALKNFTKENVPKVFNREEPSSVFKKTSSFKMEVNTPKRIIAYKMKPEFKDESEAFFKQCALIFLLDACFSPFNPLYQKWLDDKRINDFFGYEVEFTMDYAYVLFYFESENKEDLFKLIEEGLKITNINEDILNQIKRKYIGVAFSNMNQLEGFTLDYLKDYLEGIDFFKETELFKAVSMKDVEKALDFVNKSDISIIDLEKNKL